MMDFSQFFTPGAWGSFAPRPPQAPPSPQGANQQPGAPLNISPPAQTNPPPTAQGSQPNYGQLFSGISQMMNNNKPAQPPPLQMPRPAGMGMLNRLGVV